MCGGEWGQKQCLAALTLTDLGYVVVHYWYRKAVENLRSMAIEETCDTLAPKHVTTMDEDNSSLVGLGGDFAETT